LTPNLSRRVRPARAAITLMHSRIGSRLIMRSVCHNESTPPASHRSTQRQNPATPANGNSIRPSPIATFLGILISSVGLASVAQPPLLHDLARLRRVPKEAGVDRRLRDQFGKQSPASLRLMTELWPDRCEDGG